MWLNTHKTITFEGETVPLYFVSGTELGGDAADGTGYVSMRESGLVNFKLRGEMSYERSEL